MDTAAQPLFMMFLRRAANQKRMSQTALTATMPFAAMPELVQKLQILPTSTKIICAPTIQPNLVYSAFKIDSRDPDKLLFKDTEGKTQSIIHFIFEWAKRLQPWEWILIYCLSRNDTESLAGQLKCEFYHAKEEEQTQNNIYDPWIGDRGSPILTATSCLSSG